ncbi:hypothetical protein STEG23_032870 [Scotinomys teguina]
MHVKTRTTHQGKSGIRNPWQPKETVVGLALKHKRYNTHTNNTASDLKTSFKMQRSVLIYPKTVRYIITSVHQYISTSARQNVSTSARQYVGTSARRHFGTSAHRHISTSEHQHISTIAEALSEADKDIKRQLTV